MTNRVRTTARVLADGIRWGFNWMFIGAIWLAQLLIVALVTIIAVHVFMRYALGGGLPWAEEVALILVVWFTFLAMALGVKKDLHVGIDLLPKRLPRGMNTGLVKLRASAILAVALVLVYYGRGLVRVGMRSTLPATGAPEGIQHLAMPVAGVLMLYDSFMDLCGFDKKDGYVDARIVRDGEKEEDS